MLVGVITQQQNEKKSKEYLDELAFLVETAGATGKKVYPEGVQSEPKTFIGSGKINEIATYVEANDVDLVIFDDELSPSQLRNIEAVFGERKILDRTNLILDIFAGRAQTAHACTQVELAQYEYLLPA